MVAAVGKQENVSLSTTLYGVGEDPGQSGKRPFLRIWPRSWMWVSSEMGTDSEFVGSMLSRLV